MFKSKNVLMVVASVSLFGFVSTGFAQSRLDKLRKKVKVQKVVKEDASAQKTETKTAETKTAEVKKEEPKAEEASSEGKTKFSLKQKKYIASEDRYFERSFEYFERSCGNKIKASIDWASFKPVLDDVIDRKINTSVYSHCDQPIDTMAYECTGEAVVKEAIAESVTSYVCHYGGEGKLGFEIKGNVAHFYVDFKAPNQGKFVTKRLGEQL